MPDGRPERQCRYLKQRLKAISSHVEDLASREWFSDFFERGSLLNLPQTEQLHIFLDSLFTELYRPEVPVKESGAGEVPDDRKDKDPPVWLKDAPTLQAYAKEPAGSWVFALPAPPAEGEESVSLEDGEEFLDEPFQASSETAAGRTRSCIPEEGLREASVRRRRREAELREQRSAALERARALEVPGADGRPQRDPVTGFAYLPAWEPQHALYPPFANRNLLLEAFEKHIECFPEGQRDDLRENLRPWAYGPGNRCPAGYWGEAVTSQAALGALRKDQKLQLREDGYVSGQAADAAAAVICAIAAEGTTLARTPCQEVFALSLKQREQHWLARLFVFANLVQTLRDIAARDAELRQEHGDPGCPEQRFLPLWAQIIFTHIVWSNDEGGLLDTPQPDFIGPNLDTFLLPGPTPGVGPEPSDDESTGELAGGPSVASKAASAANFSVPAVAATRSAPLFTRGAHGALIPIDVDTGSNLAGKRRRGAGDVLDADPPTSGGAGSARGRGGGR